MAVGINGNPQSAYDLLLHPVGENAIPGKSLSKSTRHINYLNYHSSPWVQSKRLRIIILVLVKPVRA